MKPANVPMRAPMIECWLDSVGVLGPGLPDWPRTAAVLRGDVPYAPEPTRVTLPPVLPPAERRRTGVAVRIALAAAHEAGASSHYPVSGLASVFASSGGDGDNCHAICEALAGTDRLISPTRFHNSVHNAPSGYWGIAAGATAPSTSVCAHDASFGAGLLESVVQLVDGDCPVLLVAYDAPYPAPLRLVRPIPDAFGLAMVLAPRRTPTSVAALAVELTTDDPDRLDDAALEALRTAIPTACALPLLSALARRRATRVVLDYLGGNDAGAPASRLAVRITPC
ncbi:MAG: beta-ketoacyl synthase chain length factor [Lautropia sp.]